MKIAFRTIYLKKRFPLRISRGEIVGSDNLFVSVGDGDHIGWGEMAPGATEGAGTAAEGEKTLREFCEGGLHGAIHDIWNRANSAGLAPCALAALDTALWDMSAQKADMPLYRLLGLSRRAAASSLTIGINPPDIVRERAALSLEAGAKALKIKLGSPQGIEADKEMFAAVLEATGAGGAALRVDANGGWSLADARDMMVWLAERGAEYIEQPLARGSEDQLAELFKSRALPIFVDESCRMSRDVPGLADRVDGVNVKLMKCGGVTEALRIVATARAFGLKTMIGCMGESSIAIAAAASLGALFDYIDLDSHLNLDPDPAVGAPFANGVTLPTNTPGHGGRLIDA